MSQENVDMMRRSLEAFDRRDRDAWLATRHRDCDVVTSAAWPEGEVVHGREAAWEFYLGVVEPFEQHATRGADIVEAGPDTVLVHHHGEVRGRASGAPVEMNYWAVCTFRDRRILRDEWFADRGEALEAAGLA